MNIWIKVILAVGIAFFLLVSLGIWLLISRVSSGYEVVDGKAYYRYFDNLTWKVERREISAADPLTLKTLRRSGGLYGADRDSVFFEGTALSSANPESFQVLDWRENFSRDDKHAYWKSIRFSDRPDDLQLLTRGYSKDSQHVYYGSSVVEQADPDSFVVDGTSTSHAHDKNHRFNMGRIDDSK